MSLDLFEDAADKKQVRDNAEYRYHRTCVCPTCRTMFRTKNEMLVHVLKEHTKRVR